MVSNNPLQWYDEKSNQFARNGAEAADQAIYIHATNRILFLAV